MNDKHLIWIIPLLLLIGVSVGTITMEKIIDEKYLSGATDFCEKFAGLPEFGGFSENSIQPKLACVGGGYYMEFDIVPINKSD